MLGGEQLHRGTLDERGTDRVRPDGGLGPGRALGEAERVSAVPDPVAAVAPQHDAVRVGDDHDVLRLVGDRGEAGPQPAQHASERAGAAPLLQRLDPDRVIGRRPVGIVPVGAHPRPRPRHDAARAGRQRVPGQHRLVGAVQQVGMTTQVDSRRTAQTASSTLPSCAGDAAVASVRTFGQPVGDPLVDLLGPLHQHEVPDTLDQLGVRARTGVALDPLDLLLGHAVAAVGGAVQVEHRLRGAAAQAASCSEAHSGEPKRVGSNCPQ